MGHGDSEIFDARFSPLVGDLLMTCGADGFFRVWDLRCDSKKEGPTMLAQASEEALNCASFNSVNEYLVACGGEDNAVSIWDRRMPEGCLNELAFHENQVL